MKVVEVEKVKGEVEVEHVAVEEAHLEERPPRAHSEE